MSSSSSSPSGETLENFFIPLKEILLATHNFSDDMWIGDGGYGVVYRGQLSAKWKNQVGAFKRLNENSKLGKAELHKELEMTILFQHENVDTFLGYCDEDNEMIIAYVYAVNGSLDYHLTDPNKMRCMTWERRLKICIDAATGLKYLHSGLGEDKSVIHRNVKSANIVLDENMNALICGFDLSMKGVRYQPHSRVYTNAVGTTTSYRDPVYMENGILRTETDTYSFGVVMFELLSGMMVTKERKIGDDEPGPLIYLVRRYQDEGLEKLIDPLIRDQIDSRSFSLFKDIACQCLSFNLKERPTMAMIIERLNRALEFQNQGAVSAVSVGSHKLHQTPSDFSEVNLLNFLIPLHEIKAATKNFSNEACIGVGGFGKVYRGELSESRENRRAAIKRLGSNSMQGDVEFRNELKIISSFNHKNIIPFIGYCDEGNEMIIVYEYAVNGSLDHHLAKADKRRLLTWAQRLKIGIQAATGLQYLHSGLCEQKRVIHRDIKSANVLLDENMEAKICDFGLSKSGHRNQLQTQVYTKAAGTPCYLDPIYLECGILTKESDVYSYGVVLFELLSGILAYREKNIGDGYGPQSLLNHVRRSRDQLEKLIDPLIRDQVDPRSFQTFKEIAYECISYNAKERPTMDKIIERLEEASFAYSIYQSLVELKV